MTSTVLDVETVVIGGGVVGLAIAAELAKAGPEVMLLERNDGIGQETSSRSSEVIHAGIYYPNGSLRAKLCVEGKRRLYEFSAENGVDARRLGKLIVATSRQDVEKLVSIAAGARHNAVNDLEFLSASETRAMEPEVCCEAALFSPSTGIIDSHGLMVALEGHVMASGGSVTLCAEVHRVAHSVSGLFTLDISSGGEFSQLSCRNLIASAGHGMAALSSALPRAKGYEPPASFLAKGYYYTLSGPAPFKHLIYPVPVEGGLGTHLTLDLQGRARFGPDVEWIDDLDYSFHDAEGTRRNSFESAVRRYWPDLKAGALEPGYTGIRPKISGKGQPARDFEIHGPETHGISGLVALYGIESPGLTAALAIGPYVASLLR